MCCITQNLLEYIDEDIYIYIDEIPEFIEDEYEFSDNILVDEFSNFDFTQSELEYLYEFVNIDDSN